MKPPETFRACAASGKGLGLFLVKSLVESYLGRVWVEDRVPGDHTKGTRCVVLLPAGPDRNTGLIGYYT
jgi:signal transduction histidine kinase